jgi:hypothetical protein
VLSVSGEGIASGREIGPRNDKGGVKGEERGERSERKEIMRRELSKVR